MRRDRTKWWLVVAYGVTLSAAGMVFKLADAVHESDAVVRSDTRIMRYVIDHRSSQLSSVARVITQLGSGWIVAPIVVIGVAALLVKRQPRGALVLALSSIGCALLVEAAKQLVGRPRPPAATRLVTAHGLAFPSGHAAQSVACYGALAWLAWELGGSRRIRVIASVSAALIAIVGSSRVYLGVHWPSDVLSGWLLAGGWLAALIGWSWLRSSGFGMRLHLSFG